MRNILLSPKVNTGEKIAYLFCSDDGWVAISEKDKEDLYLEKELKVSNPGDFGIITEEQLFVKIPILRNQLEEEEDKFITIDYENGKVFINPKHKLKSIFTDTSARATNQANFQADTWTYIKNRKGHYLKIVLISILLVALSLIISWGILILLFWFLFYEYFSTLASIDNYNMGTLNASIVITKKPTRIAILTDLSMGFGKYPVVRICKMELPKRYNKLNMRIPSSCGYQTCHEQNFWDFVMPNPLVYATNDDLAIKQKLSEIPPQDWIDLHRWIKNNGNNLYEGYYPIKDGNSKWSEIEDPKFVSFNEEKRPEHNII